MGSRVVVAFSQTEAQAVLDRLKGWANNQAAITHARQKIEEGLDYAKNRDQEKAKEAAGDR